MSLNTGRSKLYYAVKALITEWDRVKNQWDDKNRRDFDERYLEPLLDAARAELQALDRLDTTFHQMKHECG